MQLLEILSAHIPPGRGVPAGCCQSDWASGRGSLLCWGTAWSSSFCGCDGWGRLTWTPPRLPQQRHTGLQQSDQQLERRREEKMTNKGQTKEETTKKTKSDIWKKGNYILVLTSLVLSLSVLTLSLVTAAVCNKWRRPEVEISLPYLRSLPGWRRCKPWWQCELGSCQRSLHPAPPEITVRWDVSACSTNGSIQTCAR